MKKIIFVLLIMILIFPACKKREYKEAEIYITEYSYVGHLDLPANERTGYAPLEKIYEQSSLFVPKNEKKDSITVKLENKEETLEYIGSSYQYGAILVDCYENKDYTIIKRNDTNETVGFSNKKRSKELNSIEEEFITNIDEAEETARKFAEGQTDNFSDFETRDYETHQSLDYPSYRFTFERKYGGYGSEESITVYVNRGEVVNYSKTFSGIPDDIIITIDKEKLERNVNEKIKEYCQKNNLKTKVEKLTTNYERLTSTNDQKIVVHGSYSCIAETKENVKFQMIIILFTIVGTY